MNVEEGEEKGRNVARQFEKKVLIVRCLLFLKAQRRI